MGGSQENDVYGCVIGWYYLPLHHFANVKTLAHQVLRCNVGKYGTIWPIKHEQNLVSCTLHEMIAILKSMLG